jgi:hypothetical protein
MSREHLGRLRELSRLRIALQSSRVSRLLIQAKPKRVQCEVPGRALCRVEHTSISFLNAHWLVSHCAA